MSKASGQSLQDVIYLVRTSQRTRRDKGDPMKTCSFLTTRAMRRDASKTTRSDQNGVGSQDTWRGINGMSLKLCTSQAVWFGFVRLGLHCEWRLRRLANPCTTRHVFNAYLTENAMRREWSHESMLIPHNKSDRDVSRATRSDQNLLGGQDRWRSINGASVELRTTKAVGFGTVRVCSARVAVRITPNASGKLLHDV